MSKNKCGFDYRQDLIDSKVEAGCIQYTFSFTIKGNWDLPFTRLLNKCIRFDVSEQVAKLLKGCFDQEENM